MNTNEDQEANVASEDSGFAARLQSIVLRLRSPFGIAIVAVLLALWPICLAFVVQHLTIHGIRAESTTRVLMPLLLFVGGVCGILTWCIARSHIELEFGLLRTANRLCIIVVAANVVSSLFILGPLVYTISQIAMLLPAVFYLATLVYALWALAGMTRKRASRERIAWIVALSLTVYLFWVLGWAFGVDIAWAQTHYGDFYPRPSELQERSESAPIPFAPFL